MATDLVRGAVSGKETKLYYNSATMAAPVWVEIKRAKNISITDGPALSEVEFHGAESTSNLPGYSKFSGSFTYTRRRGADPVYDFLIAARRAGNIVCVRHMLGDNAAPGTIGVEAPVLLGEGTTTANGGDAVENTFAFGKADAFDDAGNEVEVTDVLIPPIP